MSTRRPKPDFDRVSIALSSNQPDRVPLAEVGISKKVKEAFLGKSIKGLEDEVEFRQRAGYDYILLGRSLGLSLFPGVHYGKGYGGKPVYRSDKEGNKKQPVWTNGSKGIITNMKEFEEYPWPDPQKIDYSEFKEINKYLPKEMKVIVYSGPIFQWVWLLMGVEVFSFALKDNLELVEKMFQKVGKIRFEVIKNILGKCNSIGAVWILDDIAYNEGLMVSPKILRKYLFPWFRKIREVCYERKLPLIYHSDGNFWEVIDDIIDIGFNAIHPIEPKGMGADICQLKKKVSGKLCLIGGINLDILIRGTPKEVIRETKQKIKEAAEDGGYIAGSSNTITDSVPLGNYKAMIETVLRYGRYPIKLEGCL